MNIQNTEQEYWVQITDKVVPYIRPYYYISTYGRIGSMANGSFNLLSLVKDRNGYLMVCLHLYNNITDEGIFRRQINKRVNRLVIMSFYDLPENYEELEVNHKNSIRDDNRLSNLEWVTSKENTFHALKYGNKKIFDIKGDKNPCSKLSKNDVYTIVNLAKSGDYTYNDLANMYNIGKDAIENIFKRKAWTHLELDISEEEINMIHDKSVQYIHKPFNEEEIHSICRFFESSDINNRVLYPNIQTLLKDCFYSLNLDKKYNFKSKKHSLFNILTKSIKSQYYITSKYNYKFIR